ncbi:hypothetical protein [Kitasatospora fiedleri]|uniref:hypothetical protein n=1 Tax=Kitasatospora fiedleri TaxID=2991545 RepID=UPI002499C813|nr:hypothetical protein [Kitasatospora fiedleri]
MTRSWKYLPNEQHVAAGCPTGFFAAVEQRAAELVRAAEALYLDGTSYQGSGEPMRYLDVAGGLLAHYVAPRLELVVCQVTPSPTPLTCQAPERTSAIRGPAEPRHLVVSRPGGEG